MKGALDSKGCTTDFANSVSAQVKCQLWSEAGMLSLSSRATVTPFFFLDSYIAEQEH